MPALPDVFSALFQQSDLPLSAALLKDAKTNKELSGTIIFSPKAYLLSKENGSRDRGNRNLHKFHISFVTDSPSTAYLKHHDFPAPSLYVNSIGCSFGM